MDSKHAEIRAGNQLHTHALRLATEGEAGRSKTVAKHAGENFVVFLEVAVHRVGDHAVAGAVAIIVPHDFQQDQLRRVFHRQHAQENLIKKSEDGGVRADSERQGQYGDGGKPGRLAQHAHAETQILQEHFEKDLRFSVRMLRKSPGFAAVAILTLALGIGANTAIFTLLDQILLRMLPVKDPPQLVLLEIVGHYYGNSSGDSVVSYPMYRDFQEHHEVFSGMFCHRFTTASLSFGGQAERVRVELVSGTYFSVLGVHPALGRTLTPDDDRVPNGEPLV